MERNLKICEWCKNHPLLVEYHEQEWGIPIHEDKKHFEYLVLEVMQCGLNWLLILKKRRAISEAFYGFDYEKVASFTQQDIERALEIPGMIRSIRKINAVVNNAKVFVKIQKEFNSFDNWIWSFTEKKTWVYKKHDIIPEATTELSNVISLELKKRGMKYLGSITVYAHLQAVGIVNDHERDCYIYQYIIDNFPTKYITYNRRCD